MDVVNISRSRRFLRERPIHVTLFDRPRMVFDLLCLEPEQEEQRRGYETSDSLVILLEGKGKIRIGTQIEELEEMDAVMVPPGVDHVISNSGAGRMTAAVLLTPKPTRATEVRSYPDRRPGRPFKSVREEEPEGDSSRRNNRESGGRERGGGAEGEGPRRGSTGARPARRGEGNAEEGPVWFPKPKPAWKPRGAPPAGRGRPAAQSGPTRGGGGRPYGAGRGAGPGRPAGPRPYGNRGPAPEGEDRPARRGPARGVSEGSGFSRPAGGGDRPFSGGRSTGPRRPASGPPRPYGNRGASTEGEERPQRGRGPGGPGGAARGGPRRDTKKTGDARRASRGQGPLSGRRGPGRSGPRT